MLMSMLAIGAVLLTLRVIHEAREQPAPVRLERTRRR